MSFECISVLKMEDLLNQETPYIVDIRDSEAFTQGHLPNAVNLTADNIDDFLSKADRSRPVICYCYHGISSQTAAEALVNEGFKRVFSMDGGFEAWKSYKEINDDIDN